MFILFLFLKIVFNLSCLSFLFVFILFIDLSKSERRIDVTSFGGFFGDVGVDFLLLLFIFLNFMCILCEFLFLGLSIVFVLFECFE